MSHEGETFTDKDHTWLIEADLPCGCFVIREAEVGQVHGISYCPLHESAPALLEALENLVDAGHDRGLTSTAAEKARAAIAEAKRKPPLDFVPFLEQG